MARRNIMQLDTSGIEEMIRRLAAIGGDVQRAVTDALTQTGETISEDTISALADQYLPAGGKYHHNKPHRTEESVIRDAAVTWAGTTASIPIGFDFAKPGAGGFLITGTPRMSPDKELHKMYKQKKYMKGLQDDMADVIFDYLTDAWEGKR